MWQCAFLIAINKVLLCVPRYVFSFLNLSNSIEVSNRSEIAQQLRPEVGTFALVHYKY